MTRIHVHQNKQNIYSFLIFFSHVRMELRFKTLKTASNLNFVFKLLSINAVEISGSGYKNSEADFSLTVLLWTESTAKKTR